jgi:pimeloyl-ACP methyl ester carboxylesterase
VLIVHGTPGGYDQGLVGFEFASTEIRVIAPSRPGYLGTPLGTGRTPAQQADALAALLDVLGIERIPVIGVSGGGPATYLLAARHPERVSCLVEIDSISLTSPKPNRLAMWAYRPTGLRLDQVLADRSPRVAVTVLLGTTSTLNRTARREQARQVAHDPDRVALLRALTATTSRHAAQRRAGLLNDFDQFAAMGELPLAGITCPTLIVHGAADKDVPTRNATYAHARIPTSELHWIPGGSHFAFWINDDAETHQRLVLDWILAGASP